ncbi:phosphopentomutase [Rhizomicrobium palustre]|uniref:Phosphopentomutase n=1 Tax=Rhizomicrobium palustre TaxID=189966 RepID=A0A846N3L1_9PROT|nr:phosphopentomutase [Rhizomicrobium palustre]NIK89697.1 phosphopentomutase [Rhizomicrobium palustre]
MRAIIAVLDSFGIGSLPDADRFGDTGANTYGRIVEGRAASPAGPLQIPNLLSLGLGRAAHLADGSVAELTNGPATGLYGAARELSKGKDTPSGHWEMMGLPVEEDWGYFPRTVPTFPAELTEAVIREGKLPGILGDCHASGTEIIEELGEEHIRTGKPICYTSADSVYQIAAHETHFGLERLWELCHTVRKLVDPYRVGRVIARPFVGEKRGEFQRTGNRHDYATPPYRDTLLDINKAQGKEVIGIGKIPDLFAHRGVTQEIAAHGNEAVFDATIAHTKSAPEGSIIFANFVDFDTLFGHRRNLMGYAAALEAFDKRIPELKTALREDDLVIFTADHGCDPTWQGSDHTREHIPVIAFGPKIGTGSVGIRTTFADIGQSIAKHLGLAPLSVGTSFL